MTTCGTFWNWPATMPANCAYQVCEWITSTSGMAAAMDMSAPRVRRAALAPGGKSSACAVAPSRGSPMHWTSTDSQNLRSWGTS